MRILLFIVFISISLPRLAAQNKTDSLFTESEIVLNTTTGDIIGTLTIPNNSKTTPIVVIIAGSGPTDRDGNNTLGVKANTYKMLSIDFAKNSISTLRFDKRGIGRSKLAMKRESDIRFETYINDVLDWISLLKSDKRFTKIFLLGHSEGSLIGMIAANQSKISGFISVAGPGRSWDKLFQDQLKDNLPPQLQGESNRILDSLKIGERVSNVNPFLLTLYRPSVQPYLISWIKYDPTIEISKLKIPVLIIQGSNDLQVTIEDANLLKASKSDAKLIIIDRMNHLLKESDSDIQKNTATYWNPELPLKPGLVDDIVDFIFAKK
jgi:uncharacterized protein